MTGKIGLNHTEFCMRKSVAHKLCRSFRRELNPKLKRFSYQMNTHILNTHFYRIREEGGSGQLTNRSIKNR